MSFGSQILILFNRHLVLKCTTPEQLATEINTKFMSLEKVESYKVNVLKSSTKDS